MAPGLSNLLHVRSDLAKRLAESSQGCLSSDGILAKKYELRIVALVLLLGFMKFAFVVLDLNALLALLLEHLPQNSTPSKNPC